jgi:hypothetical protein
MTKKILSPLGFAALFVLATSATAYSDSLPGLAAKASGSNASCIGIISGSTQAVNTCLSDVRVWVPIQSRTTGNFAFYATAPQVEQTACTIRGKNVADGSQFVGGPFTLNGRTLVGGTGFTVFSNTTLHYDCVLKGGAGIQGKLQSVDTIQF